MTVGIVGGGQLGRMLAVAARRLGIGTVVLDPDPECPAAFAAERVIVARLDDPVALRRLVGSCDVTTVEIEHVGIDELIRLECDGACLRPSPRVLAVVADKLEQRRHLEGAGIPQPGFCGFGPEGFPAEPPVRGEAPDAVSGLVAPDTPPPHVSLPQPPFVWKARRGGYDGRGVIVRRDPGERSPLPEVPGMIEQLVDIVLEPAVVVAVAVDGSTRMYPPVDMVFDPHANLVVEVAYPSALDSATSARAQEIAAQTAHSLGVVGLLAVEFFLTGEGELLVNEVAPRPHNSGHWTIEGSVTDQFQQHLRAVTGLPLGSTDGRCPTVMRNVLGSGSGRATVAGLEKALAVDGVAVHLYGKRLVRPQRKMGHLTAIGSTLKEARCRAAEAGRWIRVEGDEASDG